MNMDGIEGTGFFDGQKKFRGWASLVTKRSRAQSDLTVIDVVGADAGLTAFLSQLVGSSLLVQEPASGDTLFNFQWASGFVNGKDIKVQGKLDRP
jgi:hypothetical protein